jgi:hypothetical protein
VAKAASVMVDAIAAAMRVERTGMGSSSVGWGAVRSAITTQSIGEVKARLCRRSR